MKNKLLSITVASLLCIPDIIFAQAPALGTAANFVLFSTNGAVSNSGISQLTGNVGTNLGSNTAFGNVNGVMHSADTATAQCAVDVLSAYNQLNGTIPDFFPAPLLGNGDTLNAGVYSIASAATLNLNLTLNANGNTNAVFIFKIEGSFSTGLNAKVKLINGAKACNVFWKVEGLVSMASGTTMRGTVIANNAAINMNTGDTLEGRALSTTGAVTIDGVFAYTPIGCGTPTLTGPVAPVLASTIAYALFSSTGQVSNTDTTHITGDVGTNNGTANGFDSLLVTGILHRVPDSSTARAAADLTNVYNYFSTLTADIQLLYPADFGRNLVLTPHTYLLNAATVLSDTLYLNAQGNANAVFVIMINGALSTSTYSKVVLINGAQAQHVFWKIDGALSIQDYSVFRGTIVMSSGGALHTGVVIEGRVLTTVGAIATTRSSAVIPGISAPVPDLVISTTSGASGTYNNVTVTGTGNATLTGNLIVLGNMVVQAGGKLNTADNLVEGNNGFTLNAQAVLTVNSANGITASGGAGDIRVSGPRAYSPAAMYIYAGNGAQVTGNGLPAAIDSLVIDNTNGVSLSTPQVVSQKLTLGNGNLKTGTYDLTVAPDASISGASANGYIATNDNQSASGTLKRTVPGAGPAVLFPVGSNRWKGSYTPATISMPTGTTDVISVRVFTGVMNAGTPVTTHVVNRSWVISEAVTGGSNVTVQLQWNDTMELSSFQRTHAGIAHYSSSWNAPAPASYVAASGFNPYTVSRSGITSFSVFIVADSSTNAALPVGLVNFTGAKVKEDVVLSWQTVSEINNSHFEVEASADGKAFGMIGELKGAGNSNVLTSYQFIDERIATGKLPAKYYRLKQVDLDGRATYYGPVAIKWSQDAAAFSISTFPNPFRDDVQLAVVNALEGNMHIVIYDMQGSIMVQQDAHVEKGSSQVKVENLDALTGGCYFMNIMLNGTVYRQKLLKTGN